MNHALVRSTGHIRVAYLLTSFPGKSAKAEQWRAGAKVRTIAEITNFEYNYPEIFEYVMILKLHICL